MGFFSFKCSKSKLSIPAFPHAGVEKSLSEVVMVLPDNSIIEGTYDGYGNICHYEKGTREVYDEVANIMFGEYDRDLVFSTEKRLKDKNGTLVLKLNKFNYAEPLEEKNIIYAKNSVDLHNVLGKSMNELKDDYEFETNFELAQQYIKIVRKDFYNGETFEQLEPSEDCEHQGFFYDEYDLDKIEGAII